MDDAPTVRGMAKHHRFGAQHGYRLAVLACVQLAFAADPRQFTCRLGSALLQLHMCIFQELSVMRRMPAQVLIDQEGNARFVHYGHNMSDIPSNEEILSLADEINGTNPAQA